MTSSLVDDAQVHRYALLLPIERSHPWRKSLGQGVSFEHEQSCIFELTNGVHTDLIDVKENHETPWNSFWTLFLDSPSSLLAVIHEEFPRTTFIKKNANRVDYFYSIDTVNRVELQVSSFLVNIDAC